MCNAQGAVGIANDERQYLRPAAGFAEAIGELRIGECDKPVQFGPTMLFGDHGFQRKPRCGYLQG